MISIDIATLKYTADAKVRDYTEAKIGSLDKYLPRRVRAGLMAQVTLQEDASGREDNRFVCEVIMNLPGAQLVSKEGTLNMYAAVDIVEAKLKAQIRTYKDKHVGKPRRARMLSRLTGRTSEADPAAPMIEGPTE